jgi:hypothetical protein
VLDARISIASFNILSEKLSFGWCVLHLLEHSLGDVKILILTSVLEFDSEDLVGLVISKTRNIRRRFSIIRSISVKKTKANRFCISTQATKKECDFDFGGASLPTPRAAFVYSSQRGGVRPGGALSSRNLGKPDGSFSVPPKRRTTAPSVDIQSRRASEKTPVTIPVTGSSTLEGRPPAMLLKASRITTIRPSDQSISIFSILSVTPKSPPPLQKSAL